VLLWTNKPTQGGIIMADHATEPRGPEAAGDGAAGGKPEGDKPQFRVSYSRQFPSWLREQRMSLAFTTYQTGMLFFLGLMPDGKPSLMQRAFPRAMGLWSNGQTILLTSLFQVWRFENVLEPGKPHNGFDRMYVPRVAYTTGDVDAHDVAVDGQGRVIFVNTLFSCLASVSPRYSFQPLWKPPFVSRLAAEDRCHLNGLAMDGGQARYVTAVSRTDVNDGWRDHRKGGGCVIDVASGEIVVDGLSMPHSPRLHRGRLWLLDSGTGYFGYADLQAGKFERVAFCQGYLRGMTLAGDYAVVGLSKPRDLNFEGLALHDNLKEKGVEPRCGLMVIDLKTGDVVHGVRFEGRIAELYDVVALPGVRRPTALGVQTDEVHRLVTPAPARPAGNGQGREPPAADDDAALWADADTPEAPAARA
jgi:uncharacterized protein (TIGR03032 family)